MRTDDEHIRHDARTVVAASKLSAGMPSACRLIYLEVLRAVVGVLKDGTGVLILAYGVMHTNAIT